MLEALGDEDGLLARAAQASQDEAAPGAVPVAEHVFDLLTRDPKRSPSYQLARPHKTGMRAKFVVATTMRCPAVAEETRGSVRPTGAG